MKLINIYKDFLAEVGKHRVGTVIPSEFVILINQGIEEVVSNKMAMMDINKKTIDDLLPLVASIKGAPMLVERDQYPCWVYQLASNCRRIKRVSVTLNNNWNSKCNPIVSNEESELLDGVFSRPNATIRNTYYKMEQIDGEKSIKVFTPPAMTSCKLYCDFYRHPTMLDEEDVISNKEFEFGKEMATEIILAAARMCIERNQDVRYQSFSIDKKNNKNLNQ